MNNPELYIQTNYLQRRDTQEALQEFHNTIGWRSDGRDSVLDASCGPGDVTADILLPILPKNFQRLVGIDISREMLDYARKTQIHPKLSFEQFDLCTDLEKQSLNNAKPFDHIFSFFTLMWISSCIPKCIENFYKLLGPNGDMLILFVGNHPEYDAYKEQSFEKKWASYMTDIDNVIPAYQHSKNPAKDFHDLLNDYGFTDCDVRVHQKYFTYKSIGELRDFLRAVSPFIDRIPDEDKEIYLDDLVQKYLPKFRMLNEQNINNDTIITSYTDIVAFARKKSEENTDF